MCPSPRPLCGPLPCRFDFTLAAVHVRGVDNVLADALSRLDVQRFRSACSSASRSPTPVPPPGFLNFE